MRIFFSSINKLILFFLPLFACADTVTILSDKWYPVNGDPTSSKPGYMIDIAQVILKTNGHFLDYRLAPWTRSISEVRKGRADCIVGAYKEDATDFIFPENSWGKAQFGLYTNENSLWTFNRIEDLFLIRLGAIAGYAYSPKVDEYIEKNYRLPAVQLVAGENSLEQNIRKLLAKRIDALVASNVVIDSKMKQLNITGKLRFAGAIEPSELMYIACSPKKSSSVKYIKLFSDGIVELRESGELARILNKYGVKDWIDAVE